VVGNNQDKDEDAQEIGKEAQVLVVKHLRRNIEASYVGASEK
jgi:hypothetical protein